ncbi:sugar phosphate isomerase/epimerase family protein [Bacillus sp. T33-2]|uniref:sugar phosphate isomerase/epimerase family protein n=1 Tax=Bacillus sp. T33-2 TaxID=2054168 RepID=UPI000C790CAE|nr:sugar phosphate isomerase/epimerase family protein [Bacillus sp. T33-2]PLR94676.1 myo-inositol catabolism protein IolH [Bacillus sp. T33-2]
MELLLKPKIALFPKGYMDALSNGEMSLFDWIKEAGELGSEGLELYPLFLKKTNEEYLQKIKDACLEYNLQIPMMCSSPDFTHPDPLYRAKEIAKMKKMIDVMAFLGPEDFRSCRVLSGQDRPEISRENGIKWTVECIEALLPYAMEKRVHLLIENHYKDGFWTYPEFALNAEIFFEIVNGISSSWFGVNYDPSNAMFAGCDHVDFLDKVKDRLITMHASDRYLVAGYSLSDLKHQPVEGYPKALQHGVIGEGLIDYDAIFEILHSNQFTGWISIEDGINGKEDLRKSLQFLKEKRNQYFQ